MREPTRNLDSAASGRGVLSRGVNGRRPPNYSETFHHPDVAVPDFSAQYGKVAAVG
jgi:hypothetical protein